MSTLRAALTPLLAATLLAAGSAGQTLAPGYSRTVRALPAAAGQIAVLGPAGVAWFDGRSLVLDDGRSVTTLLTLPAPVFGSFTVAVGTATLLLGESSNGGLWLVPLDGTPPRLLATTVLPFAAVPLDAGTVLVSAKTGGFAAPDNDLLAVDLASGAIDPVAVVPGASGPVAVDDRGDVYYATASNAYPAPPGSTDVIRFDRAAVLGAIGPGVLTIAAATVVHAGLDSAGAMAIDADDDAFVVDWANGAVVEVSDLRGAARRSVLLDDAGLPFGPGDVQFLRLPLGPGGTAFEPFQPTGDGVLIVHESQFATTSQLRIIAPARGATLVPASVPAGAGFAVDAVGGPPLATGVVALGVGSPAELALSLAGQEAPVFWAFAAPPTLMLPIGFDGSGRASLPLANPGFGTPLTVTAQLAHVDRGAVGSTAPATFALQ